MSLWFCCLPLLPNSTPLLVGWLVHSLGQPPTPAGRQLLQTHRLPLLTVLTRKQPIVETLSYFGSHCALMAVIIPPFIQSHSPSPLKQSSCTVGSTFCFDCSRCFVGGLSGIYFTRGGWVVSLTPNLSCRFN